MTKAFILKQLRGYLACLERLNDRSEEGSYRRAAIQLALEKVYVSDEDPETVIELLIADLDGCSARVRNGYLFSVGCDTLRDAYDRIFLK